LALGAGSLSAVGPTLWVIGTLLLLPGDFMGAFIVEKMLWKSGLTMAQLTILQVPMSLAINAAFWFLCAKLLSLFVAHPSSQSDL
jgi:hypothetical protein